MLTLFSYPVVASNCSLSSRLSLWKMTACSIWSPTARLAAARAAAHGIPIWINARTDVFLAGTRRIDDALERSAAYAAAGADSLFVPGLVNLAAIAELARGPLPVAVMVWPGAPSVAELAAAGAVRISLGSAIAQAAYAVAVRAATELLTSGTYDSVAGGIAYDTMNNAVTAAP